MAITIPKKHFVTIQYRKDAVSSDGLLGFMSPYTKDAAFNKRKLSQERWAYGSGISFDIADDDSISANPASVNRSNNTMFDVATLFMTRCYPLIVSNELHEGFAIAKSVRRSGWNGGQVAWRITDPRGFELEITSANLARILDCSTVINGVIQDRCLWGRDGADNVLLPETSDIYIDAAKLTSELANKIPTSNIKAGDIVNVHCSGPVGYCTSQYLGTYYFLELVRIYDKTVQHADNARGISYKQQKKHLFKLTDNKGKDEYFTKLSPKILSVVETVSEALDKTTIAKNINEKMWDPILIDRNTTLILISPSKIKTITTSISPIANTSNSIPDKINGYYTDSILYRKDDEYWVDSGYTYQYSKQTFLVARVDVSRLAENKIYLPIYSQSITRNVKEQFPDLYQLDRFRLVVTADDMVGNIRYIN